LIQEVVCSLAAFGRAAYMQCCVATTRNKRSSNNGSQILALSRSQATRDTVFATAHSNPAKAGRFPRPVNIGEATLGFVESEIDEWAEQRIAERDGLANQVA
jgi:predicted DNA-binding transcriptional regulator AlpA